MPNQPTPTQLTFTYEEQKCGCAHVFLSDDLNQTGVWGSHILSPLHELLAAFVTILQDTSESHCRWLTEPGENRWLFQREGDLLHLTILSFPDFAQHQPDEAGTLEFTTTCELAYFARKLWLAISRIGTTPADSPYRPAPQSPKPVDHLPNHYLILSNFIEEQKRKNPQPTKGTPS